MYLAGISVRRVEDITEALWGTRVSPSMVSNLNKKIYAEIEAWRNRRIEGEHPYLYLDGIVMKRTWAGEVRNVLLLVASAVSVPRGSRSRPTFPRPPSPQARLLSSLIVMTLLSGLSVVSVMAASFC
jgi:transposase-like protein